MVADRARRQFDAVADDVILPREDVERVPGFQRLQLALRHADRLVAAINLARVLVGLAHREVDYPPTLDQVRFHSTELPGAQRARQASTLRRDPFLSSEPT